MRSMLAVVIVLAAIPGALAQGNPAVPPAVTLQLPDPPGMPPRSGTYREPAPPRLRR